MSIKQTCIHNNESLVCSWNFILSGTGDQKVSTIYLKNRHIRLITLCSGIPTLISVSKRSNGKMFFARVKNRLKKIIYQFNYLALTTKLAQNNLQSEGFNQLIFEATRITEFSQGCIDHVLKFFEFLYKW